MPSSDFGRRVVCAYGQGMDSGRNRVGLEIGGSGLPPTDRSWHVEQSGNLSDLQQNLHTWHDGGQLSCSARASGR